MKKILCMALLSLLLCVLAASAQAGTLSEDANALKAAQTLDEQLEIINRVAGEHAEELENGGFGVSFTVDALNLPEGLLPEDWEEHGYTKPDTLPEDMREHKCIVLYQGDTTSLYGSIMVRLPEGMRAASLEEAEYALVFRYDMVKSSYSYIPPATSYHRDYKAYALNLKTGEAIRFWFHRNSAKSSGRMNELNGSTMSLQEIWTEVRTLFWGRTRYALADGAALIIGFSGISVYVMGY